MDSKIKIKEFNILVEGQPKIARIANYWYEEHTAKIVNLLKEYQDVFARDYKFLKGLIEGMGEMKIDLIPNAKQ